MQTTTIQSEARRTNLFTLQVEMADGRSWLKARPMELALEVSTDCPFRCIHCPRTYADPKAHPRAHLHPNLLRRLEPFMETLVRLMIVGDGEPMASPYFKEIIDFCLASGAQVSFSTNGDRVDSEMARRLVDGELAHIQFSVDGASPETYARIRKGSRLPRVLENMRRLARTRDRAGIHAPHIVMAAVLMRRNADEAKDLVRIAKENGADQIILNPLTVPDVHPQTRELYRMEALPLERLKETVEQARAEGAKLGMEVLSPATDDLVRRGADGEAAWKQSFRPAPTAAVFPRYTQVRQEETDGTDSKEKSEPSPDEEPKASTRPPRCTQPWTTLYVRWNGNVSPCLLNPETGDRLTPYSDPWEVWNSPAFKEARRKLASDRAPERCGPCIEGSEGRDVAEECVRVVMPTETAPEPDPELKGEAMDKGPLLALGFSTQGTSLALMGGEKPLYFRSMADLTGMTPCRFISRHAPAVAAGELYIEDGIFRELLQAALKEGGVHSPEDIRWIAYNPDRTVDADLPGGRNPVLEEIFPKAHPLIIESVLGRAAVAFFTSPFDDAALLIMDTAGHGEDKDLILGRAEGKHLELLPLPRWNPYLILRAARGYLGFDAWEESRILELASEGSDRLDDALLDEIEPDEEEGFRFRKNGLLTGLDDEKGDSAALFEDEFGPCRRPGEPMDPLHLDVAHAVRACMDKILLLLASRLGKTTGSEALCIGGGPWFHQTLMNRILEETAFCRVHAPPLESGLAAAAGCALYAAIIRGGSPRPSHLHLRSAFSDDGKSPPSSEDLIRFGKAAVATLRQQHDKTARMKGAAQPARAPSRAFAAGLLARQNERLWEALEYVRSEHARLMSYIEEGGEGRGVISKIKKRIKGILRK